MSKIISIDPQIAIIGKLSPRKTHPTKVAIMGG